MPNQDTPKYHWDTPEQIAKTQAWIKADIERSRRDRADKIKVRIVLSIVAVAALIGLLFLKETFGPSWNEQVAEKHRAYERCLEAVRYAESRGIKNLGCQPVDERYKYR